MGTARGTCAAPEFLSLETENGTEKNSAFAIVSVCVCVCVDTGGGDGFSYFAYTRIILFNMRSI